MSQLFRLAGKHTAQRAHRALLALFTLLTVGKTNPNWLLAIGMRLPSSILHYCTTLMKRRALLGSLIVKARFYWRGRGTMIIALSVNRPRGRCGVGSKLINKAIRHKLRQRRAKNWRKLQLQQGAILVLYRAIVVIIIWESYIRRWPGAGYERKAIGQLALPPPSSPLGLSWPAQCSVLSAQRSVLSP